MEGERRDEGLGLSLSGNMEGEMRDEGLGLPLSGNMEGEMRDEGLDLSLSGNMRERGEMRAWVSLCLVTWRER